MPGSYSLTSSSLILRTPVLFLLKSVELASEKQSDIKVLAMIIRLRLMPDLRLSLDGDVVNSFLCYLVD